MCCKAPGGKCAKSISKSRKRKSRKVERCMYDYVWTSKSGKSILFDFSLFDCLNFCRMPFQLNKRRLKVQNLNRWESRGTLKSWKVERWEGSRKVEKSHILNFDCYFFSPGCFSSWTSAATSTKLKPLRVEREEEKPKSRKVRGKSKSRQVYFLSFTDFDWIFPGCLPAEHAQLKVKNLNRWESRGKKKSRKAEKSKRWEGIGKV